MMAPAALGRGRAALSGDGWTRPLEDARLVDRAELGGKAAALGELNARGLPVLPGVAVSAAPYERALDAPALRELADRFWATATDPAEREAISRRLSKRLAEAPPLREVAASVAAGLRAQRIEGDVLVRSSATAEDGHDRSFAGQFLSTRARGEPADLGRAIAAVWASATAPHVAAYLARLPGEGEDPRVAMAVVVQPHRRFEVAGILFSQHPTIRLRGWALVEFLDVPPDRIVGGEVTPHRVRLRLIDGALLWEHRAPGDGTLCANVAAALARYARDAAALLDADVDMEWGVECGRVVVLQVRPATVSPWD